MIGNCPICKSPDIQVKSKDVIICILCGNEWHLKAKTFVGITTKKSNDSTGENKSTYSHIKNKEVSILA